MAKMKIDFTGVSEGGSVQAGNYVAKVVGVTKESGNEYPYLKWDLAILNGTAKGLHINHITSLKPSALFNLRNTLVALGMDIPKSAITFDPADLVGKQMGIEVVMRDYEGKEYPNVKKVFAVAKTAKQPEPVVDDIDDDDDVIDIDDEEIEL